MSNKDVIGKLVKIAENQQKIIQKLAQGLGYSPDGGVATSTADVTQAIMPYFQQALQAAGVKGKFVPQSANLAEDGSLHLTVHQPMNYDGTEYLNLKNKFKELINGKTLTTSDGKTLPVHMVNMLGVS